MRKKRKQATTSVVASSRDALGGPPTSWVPPLVAPSPSHILLVTGPHPSADAEGRGTAGLEVRGGERGGVVRWWWWWWWS